MTRGNQREKAREKNAKKQSEMAKKNNKSGAEMLREKDKIAAIMLEKQKKAEERKKAEAAGNGAGKGGKK